MSFIYVITNDINGKQYVGKTNHSIEYRFKQHINDSYKQKCGKRPLYIAMNKYGIEHFHITILEECRAEDAADREIYWIDKLNTYSHNGYNATCGGDSRKYYDYEKIATKYQELQDTSKVAELFGCCLDTVRLACKENNIKMLSPQEVLKRRTTKVELIETGQKFNSLREAAAFIQDNQYTKNKSLSSILKNIKRACLTPSYTAYHFHWSFVN